MSPNSSIFFIVTATIFAHFISVERTIFISISLSLSLSLSNVFKLLVLTVVNNKKKSSLTKFVVVAINGPVVNDSVRIQL